jgi:hypothetical protein
MNISQKGIMVGRNGLHVTGATGGLQAGEAKG